MVEIMEHMKKVKTVDFQDLVRRSKVKDYPFILDLLLDMLTYTNKEFIPVGRFFSACVNKLSVTSDRVASPAYSLSYAFASCSHSHVFCEEVCKSVRKRSF